jgi:hypothetical protein
LGIPTVLDRFIEQALLQVLQEEWDPTFSERSYGFRPQRNAHQAAEQAQAYIRKGYTWGVDIDLEKFLEGLDHRPKTPGVHLLVAGLFKTLAAGGLRGDRADLGLEDEVRRRSRTAHGPKPAEVGRAPGGPAHGADLRPEPEGCEPTLRGLASAERSFTRPAQLPNRVILTRGDVDGRQVP